jgi:hypothetical protein
MFRVGVSSEKSEADVNSSELRFGAKGDEDDEVGTRILGDQRG